jgi:two-component system, OmpR family, phosphate regulon response regulator OmpR
MTQTVLIIDDDTRLTGMLADYLTSAGFTVRQAATAKAGLSAMETAAPDAVILDVMLPDGDGFDICRRLRASGDVPILMLTARGDETDRIVGLEIGADDYLPKPFSPRELLARLKAILRRRSGGAGNDEAGLGILRFGHLEIDRGARAVRVGGEDRSLTSHQFDLLTALAERPGRILSREQLMDLVRGAEFDAFDRSIDVHISRIRQAIEADPKHPRRIITVRGAGYVFAKLQDETE